MATGRYFERLKEIVQADSEEVAETGATLGVWVPDSLLTALMKLAQEVGISRSAMARELLTIALEQANDEIELQGGQLELLEPVSPPVVKIEVLKPRKPVRAGARSAPAAPIRAKRARKAVKGRSRAKG